MQHYSISPQQWHQNAQSFDDDDDAVVLYIYSTAQLFQQVQTMQQDINNQPVENAF
jgi:hypothetical protein